MAPEKKHTDIRNMPELKKLWGEFLGGHVISRPDAAPDPALAAREAAVPTGGDAPKTGTRR